MELASVLDCQGILQLGDFGALWGEKNFKFERRLHQQLEHRDLWLVFVDGNHEHWGRLQRLDDEHPEGFVPLTARILHARRALRWDWGGARLGGLGGAFSTDWPWRVEGRSLWRDLEAPTVSDLQRLGTEPLDVLVTHDAPAEVDLGERPGDEENQRRALRPRLLLSEAVRSTKPRLVLHGHWHLRHSRHITVVPERSEPHDVAVEGFACDTDPEVNGFGVLELPDLTVRGGDEMEVPRGVHYYSARRPLQKDQLKPAAGGAQGAARQSGSAIGGQAARVLATSPRPGWRTSPADCAS